ncbi:MAG: stringent starvation protein B [Caulobacteraceae bacterium]|nr:stringent starvation protein B [Caulobacteraceae bacterium]
MAGEDRQNDLIGYEALHQEALRGVVRAVLKRWGANGPEGLPGAHHFLITFKTHAPGVSAPRELLEQYPDEMMIVLQHQFADMAPGETYFSVTLKFGGRPKTLSIPYAAITQFADPAVGYRLQFSVPETKGPAPALPAAPAAAPAQPGAEASGEKIVSLDQFRKK